MFEKRVTAPWEVQPPAPCSCVCCLSLQDLPDAFFYYMPGSKGLLMNLSPLCVSHTIPQHELVGRWNPG